MPTKCWYIPTEVHGATTQKNEIFTCYEFVSGNGGISSEIAKCHSLNEMREP
jgi:hypothetical protein